MSYITGFYSVLTGLYSLLPAVIKSLVLAATGAFLFISVLKMIKQG